MRSTFKLLFYINRNKVKSDGTTAVLCRISIDGKKSAVTTGVYCKPGDWDSKKCGNQNSRENNRLCRLPQPVGEARTGTCEEPGVVTGRTGSRPPCQAPILYRNTSLQAGEVETRTAQGPLPGDQSTSTYCQVEDLTQLSTSGSSSNPADEGHRLFGHHRRVRRIIQGLSQEGARTQERTREPLPVLAQPAHLHRCGLGSTKSQSDRGRGIREERST